MDQRFGKEYKLCSQKIIQEIFEQKNTVKQFPFVLNYKVTSVPSDKPFQIVIAAPKRIFRKAHERNRIKRLCKETIRKNKLILERYLSEKKIQLAIFFVYTYKEELAYDQLEKKTVQLFTKLITELETKHNEKN
jgi:ribonuclease P protein component